MKLILVVGDIHGCYRSKAAWSCLMSAKQALKPMYTVQLGDLVDNYHLSRHVKDKIKLPSPRKELDDANQILDELKPTHITWGNHDEHRWVRYVTENAPGLLDFLDFESLLGISRRGIKTYKYQKFCEIGKFAFTHDQGKAGENAVAETYRQYQGNLIFGHTHMAQTQYRGNSQGKKHVIASAGWMGDAEQPVFQYAADGRKRHLWQNGFGLIWMDDNGEGQYEFVPIIGKRAIVNGKVYK